MTVARALRSFQQDYAWDYRMRNTLQNSKGYRKDFDILARRFAYRCLPSRINELSKTQIKHLYQKINYWLTEIIENA